MIRYSRGIISIDVLRVSRLFVLTFGLLGSALFPTIETARDDMSAAHPVWEANEKMIREVLDRRTTYAPDDRRRIATAIAREAATSGFDPLFILAVIEAESGFDPIAVSARMNADGACVANARGLMQVVGSTWKAELRRRGLPLDMDRFDPTANIVVGVGYLVHLREVGFKRFDALLAAYLLGPGDARPVLHDVGSPLARDAARIYTSRVQRFYTRHLTEHGRDTKQAKRNFWRTP